MKALSMKQPWAHALVDGIKSIEVRTWSTKHRGPLLICASASPRDMFWAPGGGYDPLQMHAGCMIGVVEVLDCRPMVKADNEASLGSYGADCWAWVTRPIGFVRPVAIKGKLNLFEVPDREIRPLEAHEWLFDFPSPLGEVKFTDSCGLFGVG